MLTIIVLVVISFFFPPFWFVTVGYIIYLVMTKDKRRDKIIMSEILKSIALKREEVECDFLYFDSAKNFAVQHGATLSKFKNDPEDDTLIIELEIGYEDYQITFQRFGKDGTLLTVLTTKEANRKLKRILGSNHPIFNDDKPLRASEDLGIYANMTDEELLNLDLDNLPDEEKLTLITCVQPTENSEHGAFVNINNDLARFIESNEGCDDLIKMSYAYARRFAVAGMCLQGLVKVDLYNHVLSVFKSLQLTTDPDIEFQENAFSQAVDLVESYTSLFDKNAIKYMIHAVENDVDGSTFGEGEHDINVLALTVNHMKWQFITT